MTASAARPCPSTPEGRTRCRLLTTIAGNVTVISPLGEQETYTLVYKQGVQKVTSIARAASSPVAAATRRFHL